MGQEEKRICRQRPRHPQTAHYAPMSFGRRPVKEDVAQTRKKQGGRKDDKATGLCLHKGRSFSSDRTATAVNRQRQFLPA